MKITVFILIILIYFSWWEENNQLLINDEGPWPAYIKSHMHPSFGTLIGTGQKIPQITFFCSSNGRRNAWAKMAKSKPKSCHFIFAAHVRLSMIKFICSNMLVLDYGWFLFCCGFIERWTVFLFVLISPFFSLRFSSYVFSFSSYSFADGFVSSVLGLWMGLRRLGLSSPASLPATTRLRVGFNGSRQASLFFLFFFLIFLHNFSNVWTNVIIIFFLFYV